MNRPASPGVSFPLATRLSVCCCSSTRPRSPRSSTMILKPPARPRPDTAGGGKTFTSASGTSAANRLRSVAMMASAVRSGDLPLVEIVENDEHRAEVRAIGAEHERVAGDGIHVLDAGRFHDDLLDRGHGVARSARRWSASGICTLATR